MHKFVQVPMSIYVMSYIPLYTLRYIYLCTSYTYNNTHGEFPILSSRKLIILTLAYTRVSPYLDEKKTDNKNQQEANRNSK